MFQIEAVALNNFLDYAAYNIYYMHYILYSLPCFMQ
jgi:hypothetical protein